MEIPKKQYLAPMLTVVEFKVESGYAASDVALVNRMAEATNRFIEDRTYESQEMWDDTRYGTTSIEGRGEGGATTADGGWLTNDNGGYF